MIPRGICIDLETTIAGKISDVIRLPGFKRYETRIIEIGACHWKDTSNRFMRLVNPISVPLITGAGLMKHLEEIHQKPEPTLNFWSKVLVKRNSVDRTMFAKEEDPKVWLARRPETRANDFVRWFNGAHGPEFATETDALRDLLSWSGSHPWLAHNGNSFDFKVLQGCSERTGIPLTPEIKFHDTLKLFRRQLPGHKSYSQPILYEAIFSEKYNAHVAIDDALALARLCLHSSATGRTPRHAVAKLPPPIIKKILPFTYKMALVSKQTPRTKQTPRRQIRIKRAMDLTFPGSKKNAVVGVSNGGRRTITQISQLSGVGPKCNQAFASEKVISMDQLFARYKDGGGPWLKKLLPFGANWRRVEKSILAAI